MKKSALLSMLAAALLVLAGCESAFAGDIGLDLIPANGDISGPAGSTIGWGYTLTNDTGNWLVTESLSTEPFQNATPDSFFDFPALAPDSSVTVDFVANKSGLYQLRWDATAPLGFVNSGTFVLSSDYFNGDPSMGGTDIGPAPDLTAAYSATVSRSTSAPESSVAFLLAVALLFVALFRCCGNLRSWARFRFNVS